MPYWEMMESLNEDEFNLLIEYEEEISRCNGFECIFPKQDNIDFYSQFFSCQRANN